ncbi:MAG: hypothetical protein K2K60_02125 [Clostridia bacterium]|nr:hypothetical protein [Clostridia bacterium]
MKVKRILRFYYFCESLERALDNIILKKALAVGEYSMGQKSAEFILSVIEEKKKLSDLWLYIDGIIKRLDGADRVSLKCYAAARGSVKSFDEVVRKEWRRAAVKFRRRARRIDDFAEAIKLVGKYYCLLAV